MSWCQTVEESLRRPSFLPRASTARCRPGPLGLWGQASWLGGLLCRGGVAGPAADPLPLPVLPSATLHPHRPWLPWSLINQAGRPLGPQGSTGWAGPLGAGVEAPSARRVNIPGRWLDKVFPEQQEAQEQLGLGSGGAQKEVAELQGRRVQRPEAWTRGLQDWVWRPV